MDTGGLELEASLVPVPDEVRRRLVGPLACALEVRVERATPRAPTVLDAPLFLLRLEALEDAQRDALLRAALGPATRVGGLTRLALAAPELARLAERLPAAALLADALAVYRRPRLRPLLMGILNVTPDSFSDGGRWLEPAHACAQARQLVQDGAALVDVGGESTRPGSEPVTAEVELARVEPVLELASELVLSIDTSRVCVARAALRAGARVVNDVSAGLREPELLALTAEHDATLVLMHMQGTPRDMQQAPHYADVVREVAAFLRARAAAALAAGVAPGRIALDPGLGFGKDLDHNCALLRALVELRSLGFPLVLGLSRKRFLGALTGEELPARRDAATGAAVALSTTAGVAVQRVHDVRAARAGVELALTLTEGSAP